MATIGGINTYTTTATSDYSLPTTKSTGKNTLTMEDYFQLLAAQLRYQDSSNPMSNSEMMAQLTQMATVEAMNTLSTTGVTSYAIGLVGKEVEVATANESTGEIQKETGVVTGVGLYSSSSVVYVNGKSFDLSSVMIVGTTTPKEEGSEQKVKQEE